MLIDDVTISIKAGNGGKGVVSFIRNARTARGGPDGGNGGNGGSIYFMGSTNVSDLNEFMYKKKLTAENGVSGGRQNLYGRNGKDLIVTVPVGTTISTENGETYEINDSVSKILLAKGGKGGLGNNEFKSATNQTPMHAESGGSGEEKTIHLEMRLIAKVGFVGLPNAGKSSLLNAITNAHPKIGDYPFTTLEPNLGALNNIILCDIPGLTKGASFGKGLGIKFLKHIEKTELLIHCIDCQSADILKDYKTVRNEFIKYGNNLADKEEIILLTKTDLLTEKELAKQIKKLNTTKRIIKTISIYNNEDINNFKKFIKEKIK